MNKKIQGLIKKLAGMMDGTTGNPPKALNLKIFGITTGFGVLSVSLLFALTVLMINFISARSVATQLVEQPPPPPTGELLNGHILHTASSSRRLQHPAAHALDGNNKTAWNSEGRQDPNPWIQVEFDSPQTIYGIKMATGWHHVNAKGTDLFRANRRAQRVQITFDDRKVIARSVAGGKKYLKLAGLSTEARVVKIHIVDSWPGARYSDTAISTIDFLGATDEAPATDSKCICTHAPNTDIVAACETPDLTTQENLKLGKGIMKEAYSVEKEDPKRSKELAATAAAHYNCALTKNPNNTRINGYASAALYLAGDYVQSLKKQRIIKRKAYSYEDTVEASAYHQLAQLYCARGDVDAALKAAATSLKHRVYLPHKQVEKYQAFNDEIVATCMESGRNDDTVEDAK